MLKAQALFSPLEYVKNKHSTPLVDFKKLSEKELGYRMLRMYFHKTENLYFLQLDLRLLIFGKTKFSTKKQQIFISSYLQDLHIYLLTNGFKVPGLSLVIDREFDDSKLYRIVEEPIQCQQGIKKMLCNCNRNFTISQVCLDLQYYSPIS